MAAHIPMSDLTPVEPGFRIGVSPDRLTVTLEINAGADVSAATIISALRELNVAAFQERQINEVIEKRKGRSVSVVVANGTPAVDERLAEVVYRVPIPEGITCTIARVEAGQIVATLGPATAGVDGADVFGQPIAHRKDEQPFRTGRGLSTVKNEIVAASRGNLRLKNNLLSVEPLLELRDRDCNAAPVNFDGDAIAKGCISEGFVLQISGSLTVGAAIEAIHLKAGGSVNVKGGIIGNQTGKYVIGGDLRCRFISGGLIIVGGDVQVQREIMHGRITCGGKLSVMNGPIYGGLVAANGGISCETLGHATGMPTIIEAGEGIASRSFLASIRSQIEANRTRVRAVRVKIEPLLQQGKRLNAQQKEKATELLFEAEELEVETHKMVAGLEEQARCLRDKACAMVRVQEAALPGVTIRLSGRETRLPAAFKGPFSIEPHRLGDQTDIVLIDQTNHSVTVLPSHAVDAGVSSSGVESFKQNAAAA